MSINPVLEKTSQQINTSFFFKCLNEKILKVFNDDLLTGIIFIDLQKGFDSINRDISFRKLNNIVFSDHNVKWFQFYPSNRNFVLNLGNVFSEISSISCGVAVYVNDIPMAVKCNLFLYTNDTCLVY